MRSFLALEIPKKTKSEVVRIQKELARFNLSARLTAEENLHLTLAFFGNIKPDFKKIAGIKPEKIELNFQKLEAFPSIKRAKVVYLRLGGQVSKLEKISRRFASEKRPFVAHITLARLKQPQNLCKIIGQIKVSRITFIADKVSLFSSILTSAGPVYRKIDSSKPKA